MGKVQMGILDGFVGKVGTVVGSFWKGKPVMRAYKRQVSDAKTEAQELLRTRFGAIGQLAGAFHSAIVLGLSAVAKRKKWTEGDVFVNENWGCVHADTPGTATFDFTEMVIAKGNLPEAQFGAASFAEPLSVEVPMTDSSEIIGANPTDKVYLFVYSPEAGAGMLGDVAVRADNKVACNVPAYWNGHRVHCWGFAIGNGADNKGNISNSRYLGSGTIS